MTTRSIDINCDMGEGFGAYDIGNDDALLGIVSTASLACGFHGGDPHIMAARSRAAKLAGVAIGAHPGYPDLAGFGRRPMSFSPAQLQEILAYQIGALEAVAQHAGHTVTHVKVHGACGHLVSYDTEAAKALVTLLSALRPGLILSVLAASELHRAAEEAGLRVAVEIYADRAYDDDGRLMSRSKPGAVVHDPAAAAMAVSLILSEQALVCASGKRIALERIDSICVHGDTPDAPAIGRAVADRVAADGYALRPYAETLA